MIVGQHCHCDTCKTYQRLIYPSFADSLSHLRKAGWRVTKAATGWRHYCPDCVAKWKKPPVVAPEPPPTREMWWQRD